MKFAFRNCVAAALATLLVQSSCKKEDDDTQYPDENPPFEQGLVTKVTNVEDGDSTVYRFAYRSDELVDSMVISHRNASSVKNFQHLPGLVVSTIPDFGPGAWKDSTWLNADGLPTRTVKRVPGFVAEFRYIYNSAGELTHFINKDPNGPQADTTWNVWNGGNLVASYDVFRDTTYYHYDASKTYQRGEARQTGMLMELGRNTIPGANLQTGYTQDGIRENYAFQYDGRGHIVRTTALDGNLQRVEY